ncbi:hypothetical protein PanWU01x14_096490 [Parasponia andersonii]|uniref:Uncharacterized protein n=1 Tax=Parasponia andersonii TaxID=3476 RepID=A0A2P5D4V2_PARAD|nr:hypothetical protein PanWU01x14_096490 [Parasponia andersonii]
MENGYREEAVNEFPSHKVDSGKPATLTWQRKLDSYGNVPSEFSVTFEETVHMVKKKWNICDFSFLSEG